MLLTLHTLWQKPKIVHQRIPPLGKKASQQPKNLLIVTHKILNKHKNDVDCIMVGYS